MHSKEWILNTKNAKTNLFNQSRVQFFFCAARETDFTNELVQIL